MEPSRNIPRLIIHPPTHPLLSLLYVPMGFLIALVLAYIVGFTANRLPHPYDYYAVVASALIALSPILSYINIIVKELESSEELVLAVEYVSLYGIPVPIPALVRQRRKLIIAVNLGGAAIPIIVSFIFLKLAIDLLGPSIIVPYLVAVLITSIVTFWFSRVIPGVGIAVPALIPPLTAAMVVSFLFGIGLIPGLLAYSVGSLGSLLGADIFRLLKDLNRLKTGFASIGGVGVFDGIFLSGFLALLLTI